jgi:hypothetical protein
MFCIWIVGIYFGMHKAQDLTFSNKVPGAGTGSDHRSRPTKALCRGMSGTSTTIGDRVFSRACMCSRTFNDPGAFTHHEKGCRKSQKRLSGALARVRELYHAKRARQHSPNPGPTLELFNGQLEHLNTSSSALHVSECPEDTTSSDFHQVKKPNSLVVIRF